MSDVITRLKALEMFAEIPESELQRLSEGTTWLSVKQGRSIFEPGEPAHSIFIVGYGAVKLVRRLPDGTEVTMHFFGRGQIFGGVVALKPGAVYPLAAVASEDSGVLQISREAFQEAMQEHTKLGPRLLQQISQRIFELHSDKTHMKSPVPQRIADFLMRRLDSQPVQNGGRIMMRLTRQDIANTIGSTVESVIRVLARWTQNGWVNTEDHHIEILNRTQIEKVRREGED